MNNKLYILCGIPFSGKTTLAKKMEDKLNTLSIDLDAIKFEFFGNDATDALIGKEGWNRIYQEMYQRIKDALSSGRTVVHDTGNFTKYERDLVRKIAEEQKLESTTIFVDIPTAEAYKRLVANRQTKARFDVPDDDFYGVVEEMEIPDANEKPLVLKWNDSFDNWIDKNLV
ncbi:MAG: ATP-binding protein [Candidatus Shapirobacteria bacterium]|jgi:predicted kinase